MHVTSLIYDQIMWVHDLKCKHVNLDFSNLILHDNRFILIEIVLFFFFIYVFKTLIYLWLHCFLTCLR